MMDDARPSRKVPAATKVRRARTIAEASDPRLMAPRGAPTYDGYDDDPNPTAPRLTLPSVPAAPSIRPDSRGGSSGRHRTLLSRFTVRRAAHRQRLDTWQEYSQQSDEWEGEPYDDPPDRRERDRSHSSARPLRALQPVAPALPEPQYEDDYEDDLDSFGRYDDLSLDGLSTESVPDLVAYRPSRPPARRVTAYTQALVRSANNPWNVVRAVCAALAICMTLFVGIAVAGEASQPLMAFETNVGSASAGKITSQVQAFTQMRRPDLYDSVAQFNNWSGAACSAAVTAEILTGWGVPKMTIGRVIDEMGSYISPYGGLLNYAGFDRVAAKHGFRGEFRDNLSYSDMLYITNNLGLPLIVNVRQSYGYYHYFSGGHFLVMTGGDSQGLRIVDSSLYYIRYLPKSVFYGMFTGRTELLVPKDYHYSL
jgi:hypothetical protein